LPHVPDPLVGDVDGRFGKKKGAGLISAGPLAFPPAHRSIEQWKEI
jgi:hypothetical protein